MTNHRPTQPPDDLERAMHDLGMQLDWPDEPDLVPDIRQRLAAQPDRRSAIMRLRHAVALPRVAWAAAAIVVLVAVVMTVSDSTRSTVADRLGLPGVSISTDPTATASPGNALLIGEPATLDDAISRTGGTLVLPPDATLGPPDEVFVLDRDGVVQVTYVYRPRSDLPEIGDTGVGLLISQFDGNTNDSFIQKQLGPNTSVELTEIKGQPAFWLTGEPHVFYYERPNGDIYEETIRLAADVLLWEHAGKTLRIETTLNRDAAIQIAAAMGETR